MAHDGARKIAHAFLVTIAFSEYGMGKGGWGGDKEVCKMYN
jgi:hypothetical protein